MLMPLVSLNNEEANDTVTSLLYIYIYLCPMVTIFVTTVDVFENFNLRIIKFINFCPIGRRLKVEN